MIPAALWTGARRPLSDEAVRVIVGGLTARLTEYDGSMFELRAVVEPGARRVRLIAA